MTLPAGLALGGLVVGVLAVAVWMRAVPDDPAVWHVDPRAAERTGRPNDWLLAPEGLTTAAPDAIAAVHPVPPGELMARFDAVAMQAPRTRRIAGGPEALTATYVQRSRIFGFPDYVSVRALTAAGGSALVVWSRSRYGHGDLGVNRSRVEAWASAVATR